jgi:glycosyltransferase involved in cell wall biosynthesis
MIIGNSAAIGSQEANRVTVAAIIPAYFEDKHIGDVVRRTRQQLDNVLVVDDGSLDATATRAREAGAKVIVHEQNRGEGESIETGLRYWGDRLFSYSLILDGNSQHLAEEISHFLSAASLRSAGLFVGTRMHNPNGMPLIRRLVNRYMSKKISVLCGRDIPDIQCGFRISIIR